ncbi:MAG: DNA internalization-related competence protein ComEC/Rec2 [bacterium]
MLPRLALGFLLGNLYFQEQTELPPEWVMLIPVVALLMLLRWRRYVLVLSLAIGFGVSHMLTVLSWPETIPEDWLHQPVMVLGEIESVPTKSEDSYTFLFNIHRMEFDNQVLHGHWRVRLKWYRPQPPLPADSQWTFVVKLREARGFRNPGEFDYEGWLFRQGVRYSGYVRDSATLMSQSVGLNTLRQNFSEQLLRLEGDGQARAIAVALAVGDKSSISSDTRELLARTGVSHLVAISGLHIGLVSGLVYWIALVSWRRIPALTGRVPATVAAAWPALLAALGYAALAGFSLPTQRALIMVAVVMIAIINRRHISPVNSLSLALLLVLLLDPHAAQTAGFWLSFVAVAILMTVTTRQKTTAWLSTAVRTQIAVSMGLAPILWVWGMGVSLLSPLVNLLAIPIFGFLIVPLVLSASVMLDFVPGIAAFLLSISFLLLEGFLTALRWIDGQSAALFMSPRADALTWAFCAVGICWLVVPALPRKGMSMLLFLPLLYPVDRYRIDQGEFELFVLDVGQGLAVVIETAEHSLVFDTGARFRSGFDMGRGVIYPYLRSRGIDKVDVLVVSHGDNDHAGGVESLAEMMVLVKILSGEPQRLPVGAVQACSSGMNWYWDGVSFEILYPDADSMRTGNNASCVLKVSTGNQQVLLTGDIESAAENAILRRHPRSLSSEVLVAPHHGSKSSSTPKFVNATQPEIVIFSAGYANRWGFPDKSVQERWLKQGARLYTTAHSGGIGIRFSPDGISEPLEYRQVQRRYWHH